MYVYVLVHVYVNYARCQNMFSDCSPYISVWVMGAGMMLMMCLLGARPTGPCADPPVEGRDHQRLPPVGRDHGQHAQEGAQQVRRRHPHTEQWRRRQWRWRRAAGDGAPSAYHERSALALDTETRKSRQGRFVRTVAPSLRPWRRRRRRRGCVRTYVRVCVRRYVFTRTRVLAVCYYYCCVNTRVCHGHSARHIPSPSRLASAQSATSNAAAAEPPDSVSCWPLTEVVSSRNKRDDVIVEWN